MKSFLLVRRLLPLAVVLAGVLAACRPAPEGGGAEAAGTAPPSEPAATSNAEPVPDEAPGASPGNYLAGRYAYGRGDIGSSADYLLEALERDPEDLGLLRLAFRVTLADGRMEVALPLAQRLRERDPLDRLAGLAVAIEKLAQGEDAQALEMLERVPGGGLNTLTLPLMRAWVGYGESGYEAALARLEPLRDNPGFLVLRDFHAGLLSDLAGKNDEAERLYRQAIDGASGGTLRVVLALGALYERLGRKAEAEALYRSALTEQTEGLWVGAELDRLAAGGPPARLVADVREGVAEALFGTAGALSPDEAGDTALIHLQLALHLRPDFPIARILLGELFESRGQFERALSAYQSVASATPAGWVARVRSAGVLDQLEREPEAAQLLNAMAEERPERTDVLVLLGDILRANERFAEAVEAYDRAFERFDNAKPSEWTLFYSRGVALERAKEWERAEADFLSALELEPDQPYVLNYLGYSWVERGERLDEARSMIERAVELRPNDGFIVDSLGWVLYRAGDFAGAVEHLERAVELQPNDPVINDHLGDAFWRVGRRDEAEFQWQRALTLEPTPEDEARIRNKLDQGLEAATGQES